jgi:hypothetical protein
MVVDDNTVTHDTRRIDHFYLRVRNRALQMTAIDLPDLRAVCGQALVNGACPDVTQTWGNSGDAGIRLSDHNWKKATFTINQSAVQPIKATQYSWFPQVRL